MRRTPTRKEYEEYLNELPASYFSLACKDIERVNKPGSWMRRNDPIQFNVGYYEYIQDYQ